MQNNALKLAAGVLWLTLPWQRQERGGHPVFTDEGVVVIRESVKFHAPGPAVAMLPISASIIGPETTPADSSPMA